MNALSLEEDSAQMVSPAIAKSSLTALLVGASGTGKSALINELVGSEVAMEGAKLFSHRQSISLLQNEESRN